MQINEFDQFDHTMLSTLAINIIIPNLKENGHWAVDLFQFYDFYIKPRPLISMRAIAKKI